MKIYIDLFLTFFKIGIFTVGGGYAMIPIIQNETVDQKKWLNEEEFADFATLSQSLPGVIAINLSTCVGKKIRGFKGAIVSVLGVTLPSLMIIMAIAAIYNELIKNTILQNAFKGVRATVVALIFYAVLRLAKSSVQSKFQLFIAISAFILVFFLKISPPYIILFSAILSILLRPKIKGI